MKKKNVIISIILVVAILLIDQISKCLIDKYILLGSSVTVIKDFFYLTYSHNYGVAFGMLSGRGLFIIIVSLLVFVYLLMEMKKNTNNKYFMVSSALIIGGLIGNLVDRIGLSYVRDFFDFRLFGYETFIFNISDASIVIGVLMLLIVILVGEKNGNKSK